MKNLYYSKYFLIVAVVAMLTASCTNQKYTYIQRGKTQSNNKVTENRPAVVAFESEKTAIIENEMIAFRENSIMLAATPATIIAKNSFNSNEGPVLKDVLKTKPTIQLTSKVQNLKNKIALTHSLKKTNATHGSVSLLFLLALLLCLIPFVGLISIGLATDWDLTMILIGALLYILGVLPGIIFAIYEVVIHQDKFSS